MKQVTNPKFSGFKWRALSKAVQNSGRLNIQVFGVFLIVQTIICLPVVTNLIHIWLTGSDHHHGIFALPAAAWLYFYRRDDAPECVTNASSVKLSTVLYLPFAGLLIIGKIYGINFFQHLALAGFIIAGFVACFGIAHSRYHSPSLILVFFLVPVGDWLLLPLQYTTAISISGLFDLFGLTLSRSHLLLRTDAGLFNVAEACAGMRFMSGASMIAILYGAVALKNIRNVAYFTSIAIGIAFLANILRAFLMVLVATLSDMKIATGTDHYYFGWGMYFLTFALIIIIGRHMSIYTGPKGKTAGA